MSTLVAFSVLRLIHARARDNPAVAVENSWVSTFAAVLTSITARVCALAWVSAPMASEKEFAR